LKRRKIIKEIIGRNPHGTRFPYWVPDVSFGQLDSMDPVVIEERVELPSGPEDALTGRSPYFPGQDGGSVPRPGTVPPVANQMGGTRGRTIGNPSVSPVPPPSMARPPVPAPPVARPHVPPPAMVRRPVQSPPLVQAPLPVRPGMAASGPQMPMAPVNVGVPGLNIQEMTPAQLQALAQLLSPFMARPNSS
jgi:hypothetical protein